MTLLLLFDTTAAPTTDIKKFVNETVEIQTVVQQVKTHFVPSYVEISEVIHKILATPSPDIKKFVNETMEIQTVIHSVRSTGSATYQEISEALNYVLVRMKHINEDVWISSNSTWANVRVHFVNEVQEIYHSMHWLITQAGEIGVNISENIHKILGFNKFHNEDVWTLDNPYKVKGFSRFANEFVHILYQIHRQAPLAKIVNEMMEIQSVIRSIKTGVGELGVNISENILSVIKKLVFVGERINVQETQKSASGFVRFVNEFIRILTDPFKITNSTTPPDIILHIDVTALVRGTKVTTHISKSKVSSKIRKKHQTTNIK